MLVDSMLKRYDKNSMCKVYDKWPELAKDYFSMQCDKIDFKGIDHVIFLGMGGSGAIGDTLSAILSKTNMHICTVKGYHLPPTADSNTLVVATSASGNTLETLTVLDKVRKEGCKIIAFSSGGKMQEYCSKNKLEHRSIPILNSPRASYPAYLYSILNVLGDLLPIKKIDIKESINTLEKTQKQINSSKLDTNPSLDIAEWIHGIPIIYYPAGLQAAAIRFKNSLQENSKTHVIAEDVIEACHNGIVAWELPSDVHPILLQGKDDYVKTKELWKIMKEYFTENKIDYKDVYSVKGNILSKLVNLIYLLDYSTIYNAIIRGIDPSPVKSIDFIKRRSK